MKIRHIFCAIFALLGIALAALTVQVSFDNREADTVLVETPPEAREALLGVLEGVSNGDYTSAEKYIYGNPSLGVDREPEDEVGKLIWRAFVGSISYELSGDCYATDDGLAQNVVLTSLDIDSVTATLGERSRLRLEEMVEEARDTAQIYDENNEYREEVVMQALHEAAQQALSQDAKTKTKTLTIRLVFNDEQWWVVCDNALLQAISGGLNG